MFSPNPSQLNSNWIPKTRFSLLGDRFKFYFAWKVAEGASVLAGFGFEGFGDNGKEIGWKGVENIDIIGFEQATCVRNLTRCWNKRTQKWLERYTYNRTGRSLIATYFISAFWHGLYPGFFMFFMAVPMLTEIERLVKDKITPLVPTNLETLYNCVCWISTFIAMNYIIQPFSMQVTKLNPKLTFSLYLRLSPTTVLFFRL